MDEKWNISFLAEKEGDRNDRKVVMRVSWGNNLSRHLIGYRVDCTPLKPNQAAEKEYDCRWNWERQRCKPNTTHWKYKAAIINKRIEQMEAKAVQIFESYLFGDEKRLPSLREFKRDFAGDKEEKLTLFAALDEFIKTGGEGRSWGARVPEKFNMLKGHLLKYNPKLDLNMDADDANGLVQWYIDNGYKNTTIAKNASFLRWFLRWAAGKGYYKGNVHSGGWNIKLTRSGAKDNILFLEWDEVMQLWNFEPHDYIPGEGDKFSMASKEVLQHVKDCFLFQCFTGLRHSDLKRLRRQDIKAGAIEIITQKTSEKIIIELNQFSREILEKYSGIPFENGLALPVMSNQKMNYYLKILCKEAGLNNTYTDVYYTGGKRFEETKPKWEIMGTHTARRTFVVTALALGIDPLVVMEWTGHADMKAMKPYIAIVDKRKKEGASMFDKLYKNR